MIDLQPDKDADREDRRESWLELAPDILTFLVLAVAAGLLVALV